LNWPSIYSFLQTEWKMKWQTKIFDRNSITLALFVYLGLPTGRSRRCRHKFYCAWLVPISASSATDQFVVCRQSFLIVWQDPSYISVEGILFTHKQYRSLCSYSTVLMLWTATEYTFHCVKGCVREQRSKLSEWIFPWNKFPIVKKIHSDHSEYGCRTHPKKANLNNVRWTHEQFCLTNWLVYLKRSTNEQNIVAEPQSLCQCNVRPLESASSVIFRSCRFRWDLLPP
jgi:hypothetical protein